MELFALYSALQIFDERGERGRQYTIFADTAAVIGRIA